MGVELQAIATRYFGPSNVRGSRIRAKAAAGVRWFHYEHALNAEQNHQRAADLFAIAMGWHEGRRGEWLPGGGLDKNGSVFVWSKSEPHYWRQRLLDVEREPARMARNAERVARNERRDARDAKKAAKETGQ